jgi:hypothetical protein
LNKQGITSEGCKIDNREKQISSNLPNTDNPPTELSKTGSIASVEDNDHENKRTSAAMNE